MANESKEPNQSPDYKHLEMVQGVISRMARNSVQMKTWTVSLVTAVFVFSGLSDDPHWLVAVGGCIPIITFWFMDAKYLQLERCYVKLHDAIVNGKQAIPGDLNYRSYIQEIDTVFKVAMSWSISIFYGFLLIVMVVLFFILLGKF